MSTTNTFLTPSPPPLLTTTLISNTKLITTLGLGYAIALGFLVLLSIILLSSYICCRTATSRRRRNDQQTQNHDHEHGVYLPRMLFITEVDEENQHPLGQVGLCQTIINSYPKIIFSKKVNASETTCAICLCDFREPEMLRMLPDCKHYFHVTCVDAWLKLNPSCPVCRNSPLPTPLSTPLSEVVPLSQYSDGRRRG